MEMSQFLFYVSKTFSKLNCLDPSFVSCFFLNEVTVFIFHIDNILYTA